MRSKGPQFLGCTSSKHIPDWVPGQKEASGHPRLYIPLVHCAAPLLVPSHPSSIPGISATLGNLREAEVNRLPWQQRW